MKKLTTLCLLLFSMIAVSQPTSGKLPNCTNLIVWDLSYEADPKFAEIIKAQIEEILTDIKPGCIVLSRKKRGTLDVIITQEGAISDIKKVSKNTRDELSKLKVETVMFGKILSEGKGVVILLDIVQLESSINLKSGSIPLNEKVIQDFEQRKQLIRQKIQEMVGVKAPEPITPIKPTNSKERSSNGEKWAIPTLGVVGLGSLGYGIANWAQGKNVYKIYQDVRVVDAPEYTTESRDDRYDRANKKYVTGQILAISGATILVGSATWWLLKKKRANKQSGISSVKSKASLAPFAVTENGQARVGISIHF